MTRVRSPSRWRSKWAFVLCVALLAQLGRADSDTEGARLASLVRQLDALERAATASAEASAAETSRYRFDYGRLTADIQRIRAGIEDYLNPIRVQPRDLQPLSGQYRREGTSP